MMKSENNGLLIADLSKNMKGQINLEKERNTYLIYLSYGTVYAAKDKKKN